eukprot:COSAG02_NODE_220_length_28426_cov_28.546863_13_plen_107_part_00
MSSRCHAAVVGRRIVGAVLSARFVAASGASGWGSSSGSHGVLVVWRRLIFGDVRDVYRITHMHESDLAYGGRIRRGCLGLCAHAPSKFSCVIPRTLGRHTSGSLVR